MSIWVDADACPTVMRSIILRAAKRSKITTTFVANRHLPLPSYPNLHMLQVSSGFDVADDEIVQQISSGDLVITADIPLAADVLERGGVAISPRGELYSNSTIKAKLNMRDFMESMRSSGIQSGGPAPLSQRDRQAFANQLDRYIAAQPKPVQSS